MNFSQRLGIEPAKKPFQKSSMDWELRNSLWNAFNLTILPSLKRQCTLGAPGSRVGVNGDLLVSLWVNFYKWPVDTLPIQAPAALDVVRKWFFDENHTSWNKVYDFVEFVANLGALREEVEEFVTACNFILERELSVYRFIGTTLTPITNEAELKAIEEAASLNDSLLCQVSTHIETALKLFSDRKNPDYRNSMKESISAVEALCKILAKNDKTTLGPAIDAIKSKVSLHPKLQEAFKSLYAYTNDTHGIRHALKDDAQPESEDAKFMLVSCSAFVNYLIEKARRHSLLPT
jgi:hypothetical protein